MFFFRKEKKMFCLIFLGSLFLVLHFEKKVQFACCYRGSERGDGNNDDDDDNDDDDELSEGGGGR